MAHILRPFMRLSLVFIALVGAATRVAPAHAVAVSYQTNASLQSNKALNLSLKQFDPTLGLLTQVQIQASFNGQSALTPSDFCTPDASGVCDSNGTRASGTLTGSLLLEVLGSTLLSASDSDSNSVTCIDKVNDGSGVQCTTFLYVSGSDLDTFVDPTLLDWFKGTGTFNVALSLDTSGQLSPIYTRLGGSAKVIYTYDVAQSVPEPTALGLLGLGLAGIAYQRRKRPTA